MVRYIPLTRNEPYRSAGTSTTPARVTVTLRAPRQKPRLSRTVIVK